MSIYCEHDARTHSHQFTAIIRRIMESDSEQSLVLIVHQNGKNGRWWKFEILHYFSFRCAAKLRTKVQEHPEYTVNPLCSVFKPTIERLRRT